MSPNSNSSSPPAEADRRSRTDSLAPSAGRTRQSLSPFRICLLPCRLICHFRLARRSRNPAHKYASRHIVRTVYFHLHAKVARRVDVSTTTSLTKSTISLSIDATATDTLLIAMLTPRERYRNFAICKLKATERTKKATSSNATM